MPVEVGIWRISGTAVERVAFSAIDTERKFEEALAKDLSIIDPGLMLLGRQVRTSYQKLVDLLAIDQDGALAVIELKRNLTPREVVAQALDYGSWVKQLSFDEIKAIFTDHFPGDEFERAFTARFGTDLPERLNDRHRLIVVAAELDGSTERIVEYLAESYGVPINAVLVSYFKAGQEEYLTRTWLRDPEAAEARERGSHAPRSKDTWNGHDFYASFGEGDYRRWEDARRYGFISAGGGNWYVATLSLLKPGARVFVCIPGKGYVGVGIVRSEVVPVGEFRVDFAGELRPILSVPLQSAKMGERANDPELAEYAVGVDWIETVPNSEAVWEKGMFANQNSACKLRNKFTLERLRDRWQLDE